MSKKARPNTRTQELNRRMREKGIEALSLRLRGFAYVGLGGIEFWKK